MKIPPTVLIGLHVLARRGLAHGIGGPQESRRCEALDAFDPQIDAVGLELQLKVDILDERRRAREGRAKLFTGEDRHVERMLAGVRRTESQDRCQNPRVPGPAAGAPKTVAISKTVMSRTMLPSDANPYGNVHGGEVMKLIDEVAGAAATRHARARVVTARIDELSFLAPVYVGHLVTAKASVNHVGRTSMEIGVRVEAEDMLTGNVVHVASAYLVFVATDERGQPVPLPPLVAETDDERRRLSAAEARRALRLRRPRTA